MSVHKVGNHWVVTSKDGQQVLGTHPTKEKAEEQLRAIEASKHSRGKK